MRVATCEVLRGSPVIAKPAAGTQNVSNVPPPPYLHVNYPRENNASDRLADSSHYSSAPPITGPPRTSIQKSISALASSTLTKTLNS